MLGTLTRYLRFLGYDTASAHSLRPGNAREDTVLLRRASQEGRILLTRDQELARRGGQGAILLLDTDVLGQIKQLVSLGVIAPELRMTRCSLCNSPLRPASAVEVWSATYAPEKKEDLLFFWCRSCRKLYWFGTHAKNLAKRLSEEVEKDK
jgi:uncharacterized protein with PIN domain